MGGFEKIKFYAAADKPGGGSTGQHTIENGEGERGTLHFSSVTDIKRHLIPWMRKERLNKISVYAYQGETDRQLGHFIVNDEGGKTTLEDIEGNKISLFQAPRARIGSPRGVPRRRGDVMPIERWLIQRGCAPSESTFDLFPYEEGDEGLTEQEQERQESTVTGQLSEQAVALEEVSLPEQVSEESLMPKKIKGPRKPRRKKPTHAEKKARLSENAETDFSESLAHATKAIHAVSSANEETIFEVDRAFAKIFTFLQANPSFKPRFKNMLLKDPAYSEVRLTMSMYRDDRYIRKVPKGMRLSGAAKYALKIAEEIFKEDEHADPFRSHDAMHWIYQSQRSLEAYASLFPDFTDGLEFMISLHIRGKERWLDIGSGETYRVPDSLMNSMRNINPRISIVGLDPLYNEALAATVDKATGRHKLDQEWASKNELVAGTAQTMEFPDASFDEILSYFAFDKFNESVGGTPQALRQVARVLKPGGKARIIGLRTEMLEPDSVLGRYFTVEYSGITPRENTDLKMPFARVVLKRKSLRSAEEQELAREANEWVERHAAGTILGK